MEFKEIQQRALEIREQYGQLEIRLKGKEWTNAQIMEGFVGDVGDLMKLGMAKNGARDIDNVDEKLSHELSDCLWSVLVLASKYNINLEEAFMDTMKRLEHRIATTDKM